MTKTNSLRIQLNKFQAEFLASFGQGKSPLSKYSSRLYSRYNRYRNIVPYDFVDSIVSLTMEPFYINASRLIDSNTDSCCSFIAAQAPLPNTIAHFWLMVVEQQTKCIVMLTSVDLESNKSPPKCTLYWPTSMESPLIFPEYNLQVALQQEIQHSNHNLIERIFAVQQGTNQPIVVKQFQYLGWPDHSVPNDMRELDFLLQCCEPFCDSTLVHCSAGVGRTGTFCAIQHILHQQPMQQERPIEELVFRNSS